MSPTPSEVILVIPCYNEQARLDLAAVQSALTNMPWLRLLFSNDGSSDGTADLLNTIEQTYPGRVQVHTLTRNQGKAEAIRLGALQALNWGDSDFIGYWDADFAVPLIDLEYFVWFAGSDHRRLDLIMGSRVRRMGADIQRLFWRHYLGRVFATVASLLLRLPVYDTQCGAKLIATRNVAQIFHTPFISRWIFDVEVLARMSAVGGQRSRPPDILEVPLKAWQEKGGSKVRARHFVQALVEMGLIARRYFW
jgi:glycosyltransferase involved in cell wall biosynthesis